eukprot:CAMPEP_0184503330 /NCGR_PEP_ID=MMETSP0113_2-20130426/51831_1 /TAXON_ID=91329 /ORGANISM="Norrisiella sphaerica, Strain BC52" /LENGTH=478 /DNA_ID=CAMNT_0026892813 /DNA_START=1763 /DNA_END=3199 /DNA_ORIENTATION=-
MSNAKLLVACACGAALVSLLHLLSDGYFSSLGLLERTVNKPGSSGIVGISQPCEAGMLCPLLSKDIENSQIRREGSALSAATSGKAFVGAKIREFDSELRFQERVPSSPSLVSAAQPSCKHWSVVTTIFPPSEAVKKQAKLKDWCIVVVGDRKGPHTFEMECEETCIFLDAAGQDALRDDAVWAPFFEHVPWNHFARKNIGYLFAVAHGAEKIWDFDDDNMLLSDQLLFQPEKGRAFAVYEVPEALIKNRTAFNPYPTMGCRHFPCWPRGYPLQYIKESYPKPSALVKRDIEGESVAVVQSLANHDPDVDGVHRLTQTLHFDFSDADVRLPMLVPKGTLTPWNAQATLFTKKGFWMLLLPQTVHGRVADIWRSYFAQRLGIDLGLRIAFSPAQVVQNRNAHDFVGDMTSEMPLYRQSLRLLDYLTREWRPDPKAHLPARIERLWIDLYEREYIEKDDVTQLQHWLQALIDIGYEFPAV